MERKKIIKKIINKSKIANKMPTLNIDECTNNFNEVKLGFNKETAINEAQRCLECLMPPCQMGCPANIKIPDWIKHLKIGDIKKAYKVNSIYSTLPDICARVCAQEIQCEGNCVRGKNGDPVKIGAIEQFIGDFGLKNNWYINENSKIKKTNCNFNSKNNTTKKIAIIGCGPAAISASKLLTDNNIDITIFEKNNFNGGILKYGIPEFILPNKIVDKHIQYLINKGIHFKNNITFGKDITIDDLFNKGYTHIFISCGSDIDRNLQIENENANGIYTANNFLTNINIYNSFDNKYTDNVLVIGGGNTAIDVARCAIRNGSKNVTIVYRRGHTEFKAHKTETDMAIKEGVKILFYSMPLKIITDNKNNAIGVQFIKTSLGKKDSTGRRSPIPIKNSEFILNAKKIITAIGTISSNNIQKMSNKLKIDKNNHIIVDKNLKTSINNVYAGGDCVTGPKTVVDAMFAGKIFAENILLKS